MAALPAIHRVSAWVNRFPIAIHGPVFCVRFASPIIANLAHATFVAALIAICRVSGWVKPFPIAIVIIRLNPFVATSYFTARVCRTFVIAFSTICRIPEQTDDIAIAKHAFATTFLACVVDAHQPIGALVGAT